MTTPLGPPDDQLFGTTAPQAPVVGPSDDQLFGTPAHQSASRVLQALQAAYGESAATGGQRPPTSPVAPISTDATRELNLPDIRAGEGRVARITRLRKEAEDYAATPEGRAELLRNQPTNKLTAGPSGFFGSIKERLQNMRLFSGGSVVSFSQTPGGVDVGQVFRLGETAVRHPIQTAQSVATSLVAPFTTMPVELAMDQIGRMTGQEEYLLPEERSQYARTVLANAAAIGVGRVFGLAFTEARSGTGILTAGIKTLDDLGEAELRALGTHTGVSATRERFERGLVEGGVGGATIGGIEGRTPEEKASLAANFAFMAIPFGLAFEGAGAVLGKGPLPQRTIAMEAADIANARALRFADHQTVAEGAANLYALSTADDIAKASLLANMINGKPTVIQGLSDEGVHFADLLFQRGDTRLAAMGQSPGNALHRRPDGLADLLLVPTPRSPHIDEVPPEVAATPIVTPNDVQRPRFLTALEESNNLRASQSRPGVYEIREGDKTLANVVIKDLGDNNIHIDEFAAANRGGGKRAMEIITKMADENGITLHGDARPFNPLLGMGEDGEIFTAGKKLSPEKLKAWYKQFGFEFNAEDYPNVMERAPKGARPPARTLEDLEGGTGMELIKQNLLRTKPGSSERAARLKSQIAFAEARQRAITARRGIWADASPERIEQALARDARNLPILQEELDRTLKAMNPEERSKWADRQETSSIVQNTLDRNMDKFRKGELPESPITESIKDLSESLADEPRSAYSESELSDMWEGMDEGVKKSIVGDAEGAVENFKDLSPDSKELFIAASTHSDNAMIRDFLDAPDEVSGRIAELEHRRDAIFRDVELRDRKLTDIEEAELKEIDDELLKILPADKARELQSHLDSFAVADLLASNEIPKEPSASSLLPPEVAAARLSSQLDVLGDNMEAAFRELPPELKEAIKRRENGELSQFEIDHFSVSGHLPGEVVSYGGKDYYYDSPILGKGLKLEKLTLRDSDNNIIEVPWDQVRRKEGLVRTEGLTDAIYNEFKRTVDLQDTGKIPTESFETLVQRYMALKKLPQSERPALTKFLEDRFGQELENTALPPDEYATYVRLKNEAIDVRKAQASRLVETAESNGMYVDRPQGGRVILRDSETHSILGRFKTDEDAMRFANLTGQREGINLDLNGTGNNGKPPAVPPVGSNLFPIPTPNGPYHSPYNFYENGPLASYRAAFNSVTEHITGLREVMIGLDNTLGTQFFSRLYQPLQDAFRAKHSAAHADIARVSEVADMIAGLSQPQREQVTTLMETMSPDEIKAVGGVFKNRAMTPREIAGAQWLVDNAIDSKKVFDYRRAVKNLAREFEDQPDEYAQAVLNLHQAMGMDDAHLEAARIFDTVLQQNKPDELSLYGIVRLADGIINQEPSKAAYIAQYKPDARIVKAADAIAKHFSDLATKFDIPDERQLGSYFSHLRRYDDDVIIVGQGTTPKFVSDLLRTGELSQYERDPINVIMRYINAGYNDIHITPKLEKATEYMNRTLEKLSRIREDGNGKPTQDISERDADHLRDMFEHSYIDQLRGIPYNSAGFTQRILDTLLEKMGVNVDVNVRRDVVNTALSLSSSATIGFRPVQAMRDLHNMLTGYYSRFGAKRTAQMLTIISRTDPQELINAGIIKVYDKKAGVSGSLAQAGQTPTLSPIGVLTAEEALNAQLMGKSTKLRAAIQKSGELGIKWGGQHSVYQWGHAAAFLETSSRALRELTAMTEGKYGAGAEAKARAYKNLFINSYDIPVAKEFDRLVSQGSFKQAAEFLGHATGHEIMSTFGLANSPAGWGTNIGRIVGQFGMWPVWARSSMARMATRGTFLERAGVGMRFAMSQASLAATTAATGFNLGSWYFGLGALYKGGPLVGTGLTAIDAFEGSDRQRAMARSQLLRSFMLGIPGSFALRDIMRGIDMAQRGFNPISAMAQTIGIRTDQPSPLNERLPK